MESCHISYQIVETVSGNSSCSIHIQSAKAFHNICMIRNRIIRNKRFSKTLIFHVTAIILSDRHTGINHIGDDHHALHDLFLQYRFLLLQFSKSFGEGGNFFLYLIRFFLFTFCHEGTNLLGNLILLASQFIRLHLHFSGFHIQADYFIHKI